MGQKIGSFFVFLFLATECLSASLYWIGGVGNWSDTLHWSLSSGGQSGQNTPSSQDDVIFDRNSGTGDSTLDSNFVVSNMFFHSDCSAELLLFLNGYVLHVTNDAICESGGINQVGGPLTRGVLEIGRDFDSANWTWSTLGGKYNVHLNLFGTGTWRYSLESKKTPYLWNLNCSSPTHTTTLRPVGVVPRKTDIDVHNRMVLGDSTSNLLVDLSECTSRNPSITIEIHHTRSSIDIICSNPFVNVTALEHECVGTCQTALLATDLRFGSGFLIYDVTGKFGAPEGTGSSFKLTGPFHIPGELTIQKTATFDTNGFDLVAKSVRCGWSSDGTSELYVNSSIVQVEDQLGLGGGDRKIGKISFSKGSFLTTPRVIFKSSDRPANISGEENAVLDITGHNSSLPVTPTFYLSTTGDDSFNGTSPTFPWKSLDKLAERVFLFSLLLTHRFFPDECLLGGKFLAEKRRSLGLSWGTTPFGSKRVGIDFSPLIDNRLSRRNVILGAFGSALQRPIISSHTFLFSGDFSLVELRLEFNGSSFLTETVPKLPTTSSLTLPSLIQSTPTTSVSSQDPTEPSSIPTISSPTSDSSSTGSPCNNLIDSCNIVCGNHSVTVCKCTSGFPEMECAEPPETSETANTASIATNPTINLLLSSLCYLLIFH